VGGKKRNKILFILSSEKLPQAILFFQILQNKYSIQYILKEEFNKVILSSEDIILTDDEQFFSDNNIRKKCFKLLYYRIGNGLNLYEGRITEDSSQKNFKLENNLTVLFQHFEKERHLIIRKADQTDMMTYFNWANDPEVRFNAIHSNNIALSDHVNWFIARINNPNSRLFIFEKESHPLGQVRFDKGEKGYEIDYSIGKEYRGEGYGKLMLFKAIKKLTSEDHRRPLTINALVKVSNNSSNKVFMSLGFEKRSESNIDGHLYYSYQCLIA
jgi:RimJ/RimL family protein N-acetyltransferase